MPWWGWLICVAVAVYLWLRRTTKDVLRDRAVFLRRVASNVSGVHFPHIALTLAENATKSKWEPAKREHIARFDFIMMMHALLEFGVRTKHAVDTALEVTQYRGPLDHPDIPADLQAFIKEATRE
jgi:hypothetical protein